MFRHALKTVAIMILLLPATAATAEEIRVAVAANFADAMKTLVTRFEAISGHTVVPVFGSTGKHYAQIVNGASFAAFLAADAERPQRLESEGRAVRGTRFTYAVGRLVLWSRTDDVVDPAGTVLANGTFRHLAMASPELAPYGAAAEETLRSMGLWKRLEPRLVRGENIGQTFQFVHTGNAELGFVALSQVIGPGKKTEGSFWLVPLELHQPIEQQAVLLHDSKAARHFLAFLGGAEAREIILRYGYSICEPEAPLP